MSNLACDFKWAWLRFVEKLKQHSILPLSSIRSSTPDSFNKIEVHKNLEISMRDGIRLRMNLYMPRSEGSSPTILIRLPYGKDEYYCAMPKVGRFWARKGYACVIQDVRGKFCSEGGWNPFVNEVNDGYDTIDWISKQPWCDGNIGMMGESYYGYTTWAAAVSGHPSLKCISPCTTATDIYGVWCYNAGAFCLQTVGVWGIMMNARRYQNELRLDHWHLPLASMPEKAKLSCGYFREWLEHQVRDSYWRDINLSGKYDSINIPALHVGGWYDVFLKGTIDDWTGVKSSSESTDGRDGQWLMIGPYDHEFTTEHKNRIGRIGIGREIAASYYDTVQLFFDHWLKGADRGLSSLPKVKIFTIGDGKWRHEHEWPLARTNFTNYYLHSDGNADSPSSSGRLDTIKPIHEPPDIYEYDPRNPVASSSHKDLWRLAEYLENRNQRNDRSDILVYTSQVLSDDIEITGPISATLYAASTAEDTDFTATLLDAYPDGYEQLIQEGIIRASFRNSDTERSPIVPKKVHEYRIDLLATSYVVKKGHRITIEVSSSNFDRYDRSLNTREQNCKSVETEKAVQTIFHDSRYPSHVTLPIIPR